MTQALVTYWLDFLKSLLSDFVPFITYFDAPSTSQHHLAACLAAIVHRSLVAHWQIFEFAVKSRLCAPK